MRNRIHHFYFLVLLCASEGWTRTSAATKTCTQMEGTSVTILTDALFTTQNLREIFDDVLSVLSARFPCVTRQYTSLVLDYAEIKETITADKAEFLNSIKTSSTYKGYYMDRITNCSQSTLYGLKRALQLSPAESVINVFMYGSVADYNDAQLLSEVYALLKEKKSQVYIMLLSGPCKLNTIQQQILKEISFLNYGEFINMEVVNVFQLVSSLKLILAKPLNATVQALDIKLVIFDKSNTVFDVPTSITHLLITRDYRFAVDLTDPKGNTFSLTQNPMYSYYPYYGYLYDNFYCETHSTFQICYDLHFPNSYLVKNPTPGTWTLKVFGHGSFSAQILEFAELDQTGKCSNYECDPNASCEEFGQYGQCTCKEGYVGDGFTCKDLVECTLPLSNSCPSFGWGFCVNTEGFYTCGCYYETSYYKQYGCVEIIECQDRSLSGCHPLALCGKNFGLYACTCPDGYYGNGTYCEIDECQQGSPCDSNEVCIKNEGSHLCMDPCFSHSIISDPWRSTSNTNSSEYHCDYDLQGWYRFKGEQDHKIPEQCVPSYRCGTAAPLWMNGSHPTASDGIVNRTACASLNGNCCTWSNDISVKMCPGGFYVYKLYGTATCNTAYCIDAPSSCSGTVCASDEKCRIDGGVQECQCNDLSVINSSSQALAGKLCATKEYIEGLLPENYAHIKKLDYLQPEVKCGLDNIEAAFSKCLLERLRYNTSSVYLKDTSCKGVIERGDKSNIVFRTKPQAGSCGAEVWNEGNNIKYKNTAYLAAIYDGVIIRNETFVNFYCSYPLNMEISLLSAINPLTVAVPININGTVNYTITMGLFQDSNYTNLYTGSEVSISTSDILYVGVIASGGTSTSPFVLIMKNCYATATADASGTRYNIIKDQCPNRNDPTISVPENGVSLKGRFSIQMFRFLAGGKVYLHCQVGLCDPTNTDCSINCPSTRSSFATYNTQDITIGPILNKDGSVPSGEGPSVPAVKLFVAAIVFLVLLYQHGY